ncbi:MAG: M24 family metallopeptidase [Bacteroidales bacterium]|jgi:Xaa-Pro aminopeptidase
MFCALLAPAQTSGRPGIRHIDRILPEKERAELINQWLPWRLDHIVPELMHREGIDMWLIICRETNEDPLLWSLVPEPLLQGRRTMVLVFFDPGSNKPIERYSLGGGGGLYKQAWTNRDRTQFENLADLIKKLDPKKIGINTSVAFRTADGLTATMKEKLEQHIGPVYTKRLVSAEKLCVGWLETRSPDELNIYTYLCGIEHDLIAEFYSAGVIIPGVTKTEDVQWWIRDRITGLGLETWFEPSISIQRSPAMEEHYKEKPETIQKGDLLHCDVGIKYLRLCTDMQWHAYVCLPGEKDAPEGLKLALVRAVRTADVFMGEFKEGRSGQEITELTVQKATNEGLRARIYSHPIGYYGHDAGTTMDSRPLNAVYEEMPAVLQYPLHLNTIYAIEFSSTTAVPEWDNKEVTISYEEQGVFIKDGCRWVDGNQTALYLIR